MPTTTAGKVDPSIRENPPMAPVKPDVNATTDEDAAAIVAGVPLQAPPSDEPEAKAPLEEKVTDLFPDAGTDRVEADPADDRPGIARMMADFQPDRALRTTMSTPDSSPFRGGERMRHVIIDKDAFEKWVGRTDDGYKLIMAWGNPINGIYTPSISIDRSDKLG